MIFKPRVEFFGHDLTARGNYLVKLVPPIPRNQIYSSLVCVASIIDIVPSLKPTINNCENCSNFIIIISSLSWDGHNSSARVRFTTLSHFYDQLHRLHHSRTTISTLISRIKPCAYPLTWFSYEHRSCHYFDHCNNLILDSFVSKKITVLVKFLFSRVKLRIILLPEMMIYVLRRTTPNILNFISLDTIRY